MLPWRVIDERRWMDRSSDDRKSLGTARECSLLSFSHSSVAELRKKVSLPRSETSSPARAPPPKSALEVRCAFSQRAAFPLPRLIPRCSAITHFPHSEVTLKHPPASASITASGKQL